MDCSICGHELPVGYGSPVHFSDVCIYWLKKDRDTLKASVAELEAENERIPVLEDDALKLEGELNIARTEAKEIWDVGEAKFDEAVAENTALRELVDDAYNLIDNPLEWDSPRGNAWLVRVRKYRVDMYQQEAAKRADAS